MRKKSILLIGALICICSFSSCTKQDSKIQSAPIMQQATTISQQQTTMAKTEKESTSEEQSTLEKTLTDYFRDFYSALSEDSTKEFSKKEFASTDGYIKAKYIVYTRESYKKSHDGISDVKVNNVTVTNSIKKDKIVNAEVLVEYSYMHKLVQENRARATDKIKVTILEKNGKYIIRDLDCSESDVDMEMIQKRINGKKDFAGVDKYFKELENMKLN